MADSPDPYATALGLAREGRLDAAAAVLETLLTEDPGHRPGWQLLAAAHTRLGRPEAALACYNQMLVLDGRDAEIYLARGVILGGLGQWAEALASFDQAIALDPDLAFAHNNRAQMLNALDRPGEALAAAERALALDAGLAHAWRHRGFALFCMNRLEEAAESYRHALDIATGPTRVDALCDLGMTLTALGRYDEARTALDAAVAAGPDAPMVRFRRAETRLLQGDFAGGWDDYEARWRVPVFTRAQGAEMTTDLRRRLTLAPRIQDLTGQRVLVVTEQGVGDEVMFASVLPDLARVAARVTCIVDPRLVRLLSHSMPQVEVVAARTPGRIDLAAIDRVVALGSLASMFRRTREAFPGRPYLSPSPTVPEAWRARLGARRTPLRVGISWRGGLPRTRTAARSLDLAALRPLLVRSDCEFVSLQYGDVEAELAACNADLPRPIRSFPRQDIDDFEDLSGLVVALDAVVTVQTALAHLTGALGQTGLVMIPQAPEWRYGAGGERMAWYGSLRLLRQAHDGDWPPVLARVGEALDEMRPRDPPPAP